MMKINAMLSAALLSAAPADFFDTVRARVLPSAEEHEFLEIPWRAALWDALVEADAAERPVLLWAMNGHPLGCT